MPGSKPKTWYDSLLNVGVHQELSIMEQRRLRLINSLILVCIGLSGSLFIITIVTGLSSNAINLAIALASFFLVFWFHSRRWYLLGRYGLFFIVLTAILIGSTITIYDQRDTQPSIILLGVSALTVVVFDKIEQRFMFIITVVAWLYLHVLNTMVSELPFDSSFWLTITNFGAAILSIYFFTHAFRTQLEAAMQAVDERTHKVKEVALITQAIIDNAPAFLALFDTQGHYIQVNKLYSDRFGRSVKDFRGRHYTEVLPSNLVEAQGPLIEQALSGEEVAFETQLVDVLDGMTDLVGKYVPVRNAKGQLLGVSVYGSDITKLRNQERQLAELNQTKDRLFSIVAHDLKSPLRVLNGLLQLSSQDYISQEEFKEHTTKLSHRVAAVSLLMDNLLEWSQSQLEGMVTHPESVKVATTAGHIVNLFHEEADLKGVELSLKMEDELTAWADPNHFSLMLRNLVNNALKYTNEGDYVKISAREEAGWLHCEVKDSGVGMEPNTLRAIQQGDGLISAEGTAGETGSGLGISLILEMLERNGGTLQVQSTPNQGSHFRLMLPIAPPQEATMTA